MKRQILRFLSVAAAAATVCAGSTLHVSAEAISTPGRIMGDLTGDNRVTLYDCLSAVNIYNNILLGLTDETVDDANYPADIDMNGKITLSDLISMNNYYTLEMLGLQPMWADVREVSYVDGSDSPESEYFTLTGLYLEIGCVSGKPGEEVTVPVYIAGVDTLAGMQYRQSIPEGFTVIDGTTCIAAQNDIVSFTSNYDNYTHLVWAHFDPDTKTPNADITDGVILATFTYKIPEDAKSGDTYIISTDKTYNYFSCRTVDGDNLKREGYQYTAVSGVIVIE